MILYQLNYVLKGERKTRAHRVFLSNKSEKARLGVAMKFYSLTSEEENAENLQSEYKDAQEIGKIHLGTERLYFRSARKIYYIRYTNIYRYFRRVMLVPAKLCCGKGDFAIEHLVICDIDRELAQIQLPGSRAAKVLMERMSSLAPDAIVGMPADESDEEVQMREDSAE